ncbi:MAG: 4-hydroxy-tetrahydrodipicolinate synthase, partial [Longimicrobiales bacterium]
SVLHDLVRFHVEEGTDALIICGSTGEAATMSIDEQRIATAVAVDAAARRIPIIVGCGGSDTKQVVRLGVQAANAGADGILLSAPPYNKPPQRGLIAHFRAVVEAADLPAVIYNVPGRSAVNILPETIAALADDDRFVGIKEASGDISQIAEVARLVGGRMTIWSGNDDQTIPVMALGGRGIISVLGNAAPSETSRMAHAWLDGDTETALKLQLRFLPLIRLLFTEPNPIPIKMAVAWLGFDVGDVRLPLVAASAEFRERLVSALNDSGVARSS